VPLFWEKCVHENPEVANCVLEQGHACRIVEDGGGVCGDGSLTGIGAAHGAAALLEQHEACTPGR
jgi:hypothetical protein